MGIDPSAFAGVARIPEHSQDGATGDVGVAVFSQRGGEPADPRSSRDRVEAKRPNALGVVAVDGVAHRVV